MSLRSAVKMTAHRMTTRSRKREILHVDGNIVTADVKQKRALSMAVCNGEKEGSQSKAGMKAENVHKKRSTGDVTPFAQESLASCATSTSSSFSSQVSSYPTTTTTTTSNGTTSFTTFATGTTPSGAASSARTFVSVPFTPVELSVDIPQQIIDESAVSNFVARESLLLSSVLYKKLKLKAPITHVYNPLEYAQEPFFCYLRKFCQNKKKVLFIGMNPGPFGMATTGVPFGDVTFVRDWMGIEGFVGKPSGGENSKRPILGFSCQRAEVSGTRLWGLAKELSGTADRFFEHALVHNYCPLVFMERSGRNVTPDKLPMEKRKLLLDLCDESLRKVCKFLEAEHVIGIGKFATDRVEKAFAKDIQLRDVKIGTILHPSPASPIANRGWAPVARRQMEELGILQYLTSQT